MHLCGWWVFQQLRPNKTYHWSILWIYIMQKGLPWKTFQSGNGLVQVYVLLKKLKFNPQFVSFGQSSFRLLSSFIFHSNKQHFHRSSCPYHAFIERIYSLWNIVMLEMYLWMNMVLKFWPNVYLYCSSRASLWKGRHRAMHSTSTNVLSYIKTMKAFQTVQINYI